VTGNLDEDVKKLFFKGVKPSFEGAMSGLWASVYTKRTSFS